MRRSSPSFTFLELGPQPVAPRVPQQQERAAAAAATDVGQPQEVEGLRLAEPDDTVRVAHDDRVAVGFEHEVVPAP